MGLQGTVEIARLCVTTAWESRPAWVLCWLLSGHTCISLEDHQWGVLFFESSDQELAWLHLPRPSQAWQAATGLPAAVLFREASAAANAGLGSASTWGCRWGRLGSSQSPDLCAGEVSMDCCARNVCTNKGFHSHSRSVHAPVGVSGVCTRKSTCLGNTTSDHDALRVTLPGTA